MKKKETPAEGNKKTDNIEGTEEGYPLYPPSEDIYNRFKEEKNIDPEDPTKSKEPLEENEVESEEDPELLPDDDLRGEDLDVPGAELDDEQEEIGSEDEENNYYSIGGDNHHDLEEDDGLLDEEI